MKPKAKVKLVSEQSPEPVPSHGGPAVGTWWKLTVEGVVIAREYDRRHWCADRAKYTKIEWAPSGMVDLFNQLCAAFDPPDASPAGVGGEAWQDIVTVPTDERLIIVGSYNAKGQWCSEVWSTHYVRDQFAKSAMGFFDKARHLQWLPTHWTEMPTPPLSKGAENGKT